MNPHSTLPDRYWREMNTIHYMSFYVRSGVEMSFASEWLARLYLNSDPLAVLFNGTHLREHLPVTNTTDLLDRLASLCQCSVSVEINKHRDDYQTAAQFVENMNYLLKCQKSPPLDPEIAAKMIELDTTVDVTFYPRTPIGNHWVLHYDLRAALEVAVAIAERGVKL